MTSTRKLTHYRKSDFASSRRKKPKVRELNRQIRTTILQEHHIVQAITADAKFRASQMFNPDPLAVWLDFDHLRDYTQIDPTKLPEWRKISQFLKVHLLFRASVIFGGYSFTANIRPDLQNKWIKEGRSPIARINKLISNEISRSHPSLKTLAFCYVVEGRSRKGTTKVKLHIHGFLQTDNPFVATRFKKMLENAVAIPKHGLQKTRVKSVLIEPLYDKADIDNRDTGRWAGYITKNATRVDNRLKGKRLFISREGTALAKEFWKLVRNEDPSNDG